MAHATTCEGDSRVYERRELTRVSTSPNSAEADGWAEHATLSIDPDSGELVFAGVGGPVVAAGDLRLEHVP